MKIKLIIFWILSLTWGVIMSIIGLFVALIMVCIGLRPKLFHGIIYFVVPGHWGGINLGCVFVTCSETCLHTAQPEAGHALQNVILGPLYVIVGIWSLTRCVYRKYLVKTKKKTEAELPDYYSIWFEKWANILGEKYFKNW